RPPAGPELSLGARDPGDLARECSGSLDDQSERRRELPERSGLSAAPRGIRCDGRGSALAHPPERIRELRSEGGDRDDEADHQHDDPHDLVRDLFPTAVVPIHHAQQTPRCRNRYTCEGEIPDDRHSMRIVFIRSPILMPFTTSMPDVTIPKPVYCSFRN